jgi:hypothetical protein
MLAPAYAVLSAGDVILFLALQPGLPELTLTSARKA